MTSKQRKLTAQYLLGLKKVKNTDGSEELIHLYPSEIEGFSVHNHGRCVEVANTASGRWACYDKYGMFSKVTDNIVEAVDFLD